jgi:hypothetical protein
MGSTSVAKANTSLAASAPATDATGVAIGTGGVSATLSGAASGAGGTITFTVFGPQASAPTTCTSGGSSVGTATVSGAGTYNPSAGYTPSTVGTYWWYASYTGDSSNTGSNSTCGPGMTSTVVKNATAVTAVGPSTDVSGTAIVPGSISSVLVGGTGGASGTITYTVFGPQDTAPTTCTSGGTAVGTASVSGNASYHPSAGFTPSSAGVYWWYASYTGDTSDSASNSGCGSSMAATYVYSVSSAGSVNTNTGATATTSSFTVQPSTTYLLLLFRHSSAGDAVSSISSTGLSPALTLSSFTSITSQTYGSNDYQWAYWITTASSATGTGTLTVNFNNTLAGGQMTGLDLLALGGVNATNPVVVGNEALTKGTNTSSATANLAGAPNSIDAGLVFLSSEKAMPPTAPTGTPTMTNAFYFQNGSGSMGTYSAVPGAQSESFALGANMNWGTIALELRRAGAANSTATSAGAPATGTAGSATAASSISSTLSGATSGAAGPITFKVFGPQATAPTTCTSGGTTVGSLVTVSGNGTYNPSAGFTPSAVGTYWWYASYGGDGNNLESTSTCGSGMASTFVGSDSPTITAGAPSAALSGAAISASSITSTLAAGASPTGTITYKVFGPQTSPPTTCTIGGTTVGTSTVSGNAGYGASASYTPSNTGVYWWYASYAGDSNNNSATSACGSGMPSTYVYSASSVATANASTGSSATTSTFTVQPSTTYLLLVYRHSAAGDGLGSLSSTSLSPALTLSSFTSITSQTYDTSKDYQWAYWITTSASASGSGTLTLNFTNTLGGGSITLVDLIQIGGVKTTAPVVTSNEIASNANSGSASANLPSAPGTGDLGLVFLTAEKGLGGSAPAGSPAMNNLFYSQSGIGSIAPYVAAPAVQNESFTFGAAWWGTIGLELTHP